MSLKYEVYRDYNNGNMVYFRHDERHRDNGPANLWYDGYAAWYQYGYRHRLDGPATIWEACEQIKYAIRGKFYSKEEYESKKYDCPRVSI